MIEILKDISILKDRNLNICHFKLLGVTIGGNAKIIPIEKIDEKLTFQNNFSKKVKLEDIVENVINTSGLISIKNKLSFLIKNGKVVGFSIFNKDILEDIKVTSYKQFIVEFGEPDKIKEDVQYGELIGYYFYFFRQKILFYWSCTRGFISVTIGNYKIITKEL